MNEKDTKEFTSISYDQNYLKSNFTQKSKMERNASIIFSFVIILCFIIYNWIKIRRIAFKTAKEIMSRSIKKNTNYISERIEEIYSKYKISSNFLLGISHDSSLIKCRKEDLYQFVKYAKAVHANMVIPPTRMYLKQENKNYCEIDFSDKNNESIYDLYFFQSAEDTCKKFNHTVDLTNLDFENDGTNVNGCKYVEQENSYNFWYSYYSNGFNEQIMSIESHNFELTGFTGLSLSLNSLAEILTHLVEPFSYKMAITKLNENVLIEGEHGVIKPLRMENKLNPIYPSLEQIESEFWKKIAPNLKNIPDETPQIIIIDDYLYLACIHVIAPENVPIMKLINIMQIDQSMSSVFKPVTCGFISFTIFILLLSLLFAILQKRNTNEKHRKLEKEQAKQQYVIYGKEPSLNGLSKAILKLRNLQLRYPEYLKFNKILDNIVSNLAEKNTNLYGVELKQNCDCEFCSYLIPPKLIQVHDPKSIAFSKWPSYISSHFRNYESLGTLDFPYQEHINNPVEQLVILFITIIKKEKLFFAQFDPDLLIQFMFKFASVCCKDTVHTAHIMFSIYYLLHGKFKHWLSQKIDQLILYFVAFVYHTDYLVPCEISNDSYTESIGEFLKVNFSNESYSEEEAVQALKFHMNVFNDDTSEITRNIQLVFDLFHEFIPKSNETDELVEYFISNVKELFYSVQNKKQFSLLNEFSTRIESPYFSVINEQNDKLLFMKSLFKLCDYCTYWCSKDIMVQAANRITDELFEDPTIDDSFIAEFHFEHASTIVSPWISVFINFNPLEEIVENFINNINYWKKKMR